MNYEEAIETLETVAMKYGKARENLETARAAMMDAVDELRKLDDPAAHEHAQEMAGAVDVIGSWVRGLTAREKEATE